MSPARTLVYRLMQLPNVRWRRIAIDLGLCVVGEGADYVQILRRASKLNKLAQLWDAVEAAHGDGKNPANPYVPKQPEAVAC